MSDYEEAVAILKRMEQNQQKALDMQAEQLAMFRAQMERTEARVQESIAIQKATVSRYAKLTNFLVPVILAVLVFVCYLAFKYA